MTPIPQPRLRTASARHVSPQSAANGLLSTSEVFTLDGCLPVSHLCVGDRIISRNQGVARLLGLRVHKQNRRLVSIAPGTLGNQRPNMHTTLCAEQEILLRDWRARALFNAEQALVPVARLIDGCFVRDTGVHSVCVVELQFETPQIIYADGLELAADASALAPA